MTEPEPGLSRRAFLVQGSLYGGGLVLSVGLPRPEAWAAAQASTERAVLTEHEWISVEAITARILPTDGEPGAREAGCVNFIDKALAHEDASALPVYRNGVVGIDAVSRRRFEAPFAKLAADRQDEVLAALERGQAPGWPEANVPASLFFETVRAHTLIGFLAEPRYGGNRGYAGWRVTGYPGPRHHTGGYTPGQMLGDEPIVPVWNRGADDPSG